MSHGVIKDGIYFKKEKEKDLLRMGGGSWSINLGEVDLETIKAIVFCTEKAHYIASPVTAALHGFKRELGGEEKLVLPLKHWEVRENDTTGKA